MINGRTLKNAIISGANVILSNKTSVDELNIFPVPDGDTGTNMSMTISSAKNELSEFESDNAYEVAKKAASAMLRGARGNSGVILSILFKGFGKGLDGKAEINGEDIINALAVGVEDAYKSVMKPTEGTMLTVARVACECGRDSLKSSVDPIEVWDAICEGAYVALEDTPRLLPVLKKAGVVDAGGKGLCLIFDGMRSVFKNGVICECEDKVRPDDDFFKNAAAEFDSEINFTYCTECIIGRDDNSNDSLDLREYLMTIGDCVVVADDEDIIKVHVHTENPGKVLEKALEFGSLLTVKIENMKEQHRKASENNEKKKAEKEVFFEAEPQDEYGFVSVAAGDGIKALFSDLGCQNVVSGGQTMNPSTEDIYAAIKATPAKVVYVFPNNKNIIMAAQQAVPMVTDRKVFVVPTKTIPQGISAMLAFDADAVAELNVTAMMEASSVVKTGQVTFAARDSEFGGNKIKQDDILALNDGKLDFVEKDIDDAAFKLIKRMTDKSTSFITVIYGEGVSEAQAEHLSERIGSKYGDDVELTVINGGQPVYYYIISIE